MNAAPEKVYDGVMFGGSRFGDSSSGSVGKKGTVEERRRRTEFMVGRETGRRREQECVDLKRIGDGA
jgi:hypothetical protein